MPINEGFVDESGNAVKQSNGYCDDPTNASTRRNKQQVFGFSSETFLVTVFVLVVIILFFALITFVVLFTGMSRIDDNLADIKHDIDDKNEEEDFIRGVDYKYDSQAFWFHDFPQCSGIQQSPIRIFSQTVEIANSTSTIVYEPPVTSIKLQNTGHSYKLSPYPAPSFTSGTLGDANFTLAQMHFHWGAEHWIDDDHYSSELHMVTHLSSHSDLGTALGANDVAVFGLFLEECAACNNPNFERLVTGVTKIVEAGSTVTLSGSDVMSVWTQGFVQTIFDNHAKEWYHYNGSLTTPPCNEGINWNVFRSFEPMPSSVLNKLKTLKEKWGDYMENNYRVPQPQNTRIVIRFKDSSP